MRRVHTGWFSSVMVQLWCGVQVDAECGIFAYIYSVRVCSIILLLLYTRVRQMSNRLKIIIIIMRMKKYK